MFKKLSTRFIVATLLMMLISSLLGFILTNVYYHFTEKPKNDARVTEILLKQKAFAETHQIDADEMFAEMANLNFQVLAVNDGEKKFYGTPFRKDNVPLGTLDSDEAIYHGIKNREFSLFITGFFDNETKNTVGTKMTINGETYDVYLRPDVGNSMGEFRVFLAVLLVLVVVFSIVFVFLSSKLVTLPVVRLSEQTREIQRGNYDVSQSVVRRDEIGTLAREMQAMSESIKRHQEMNERFVANVSHEIQSPISNLLLLLEKMKDSGNLSYIKDMEHQSMRLSNLTKQLLLLASIEQSEQALEKETFSAKAFVKDLVQTYSYMLDQKNIFMITNVEDIEIFANEKLLFQAVSNIVNNAIKFSLDEGEITISVASVGGFVEIKIRDHGKGMSEDMRTHLFERFYKANHKEDHIPSNGLGMSIVKEIVDLHGGLIEVWSKENVGTLITIKIPVFN